MRIEPFELERWQSLHEHQAEINIAESGVEPMTTAELIEDPRERAAILEIPHGYPQTNGSALLRERIAALYPGAGPENVLVTNGCAEANFLLAWSLLGPHDAFVFMEPNYLQLGGLARAFGAEVIPLPLHERLNWAPDLEDFFSGPSDRPIRMIAVCHPNNPTGAVLDEPAMERICREAGRSEAWLLADEVYRGAEFAEQISPTFWGRYERVVCTGGLSKAYGLPGLRIGWVVGPASLVEQLWSHRDYTSICPTALSDRLASAALAPERRTRIRERTRRILHGNYALVEGWLGGLQGRLIHCRPAAGAIAWVRDAAGGDTDRLARVLLEKSGVLVVPGEQFGMRSHLRIGFGGDPEQLTIALERIGEWVERGVGA